MSRPLQLTSWTAELASRFPDLPARVVAVLALYSFGVLLAHACGLGCVALALAKLLRRPFDATRKRLSEFYKEAPAKSGAKHGVKRRDFDPAGCFAPLLRWVLSLWSGRQLPLAIDVTNLGGRFHLLCVSVVVGGVGLPVAWKALPGGVKEPWNPHWQALLRRLKAAVPDGWTVLVLSDRGLESPWLFGVIKGLGWHPLMRAKKGGKFRPAGWGRFYRLGDLVRRAGGSFYAEGRAYAGEKMPCTLLACWGEGHDEPWLVLTDLPPEAGDAAWYALRGWVEQGFKVIKGGGWDWDKTRMEDPARVERLWLVLAVATLWVVAVGAEDEAREATQRELAKAQERMSASAEQARLRQERERRQRHEAALKERQARQQRREGLKQGQRQKQRAGQGRAGGPGGKRRGARVRIHRLSRRGLAELRALWQQGRSCLPEHLHPEPWPDPAHSASSLTEEDFMAQQT